MKEPAVVVAGATGNLGGRIVKALRARGAKVVALTRASSNALEVARLKAQGAEVAVVDPSRAGDIAKACAGASCVVSALLAPLALLDNARYPAVK